MKFSPRYLAILLLSIGMSNVAIAGLDSACMPVINSSEARAAQATWESVTVVSPNDFKMEAMKVGGQHYTRMTGSKNWKKAAMDLSEPERKVVAEIKSGKIKISKCKAEASETVDGVAMQVVSYTIEMAGVPAASAKLYIGKSDGLPYAQTGKDVKTRFRYTGITAPKP
jgi:hypothetical protein